MLKISTRKLYSSLISAVYSSKIPKYLFRGSLGVQSARIEINGACNAKCTFCHSGRVHYDRSKLMDPAFFNEILAHLQKIGLLTKYIWLYDRGEPFLHPQLGEILDICSSYGVRARLSTNASSMPDLSEKQWKNVAMLKVSLSGMSDSSYGRIHGLSLSHTLENIELIAQRASILCFLQLSWHRYRFNLDEEADARSMAEKLGYRFSAIDAEIIEVEKLLDVAEGKLTRAEIDDFNDFLLVERSSLLSRLFKKEQPASRPEAGFVCVQYDQVTVNYDGELIRCCGLSPDNSKNRLGSVFSFDGKRKLREQNYSSCDICQRCISWGIAEPSKTHLSAIWD